MNRRLATLLLTISVSLLGCSGEEAPLDDPTLLDSSVVFDSGSVAIATTDGDTVRLRVEVAESDQQRSLGLMQRTSLDEDAGMIFLFPSLQPAEGVFWMYRTLIPLSIAFIGEDGRIGSIRDMEPCTSPYPQWCPGYESGVPFRSALEVNHGFFGEHGVTIGDEVILHR